MTESKHVPGQLTQLFFPGRHSGVGGGEPTEVELSNYALNWLVSELKRRGIALKLHEDRIEPGSCNVPPPPALGWKDWTTQFLMNRVAGIYIRPVNKVADCHPSVAKRYALQPEWRPRALEKKKRPLSKVAKDFLSGVRDDLEALVGLDSDSESDGEE